MARNMTHKWFSISFTVIAAVGIVHAQTSPDAGTLLQQLERDRGSPLPKRISPAMPAAPAPLKSLPGATVTVKGFRFSGNTLLTAEQLTPIVAPWLHRPLGFAELQQAADAVARAYREAGWIVRAYLPRQDITNGLVTIQIVESVFGSIHIEGGPTTRLKSDVILATFAVQQKLGEPLNAEALDRALLLADDLPGVTVAGVLREGKAERETDLVLKIADEPLLTGEAGIDNTGSRATGEERLIVNAALNSPLKLGDLLTANALHASGSNYARLGWSLPVGHNGLRIGANASSMDYRLVASEFQSLNAGGNSNSSGIDVSYPLIRSRLRNLYFGLAFDARRFENRASNAITSRYNTAATALSLTGNLFDNWGGGGANSASLAYVGGNVDLSSSPNQAADLATTRTEGNFGKWRYSLSRQQVLSDALSLYASLAGQVAEKNLDSSEKFYLGGANGVRAYPANEGGGSDGMLANLELRWRFAEGVTLTGFTDWGRVVVNKNNSFSGAAEPNQIELAGAGLSLSMQTSFGLNIKGTWATRLGENPLRNATTGRDQDGSYVSNRFWLQATIPF